MGGKLILKNGSEYVGENFGALASRAGEVVFSTGMMGYPESLTDPSFKGQILVLTYPLVGNYGIPDKKYWESSEIQISGLVVSDYINTPYHFQSRQTLGDWLKSENIPGLIIKDTRFLTRLLREKGSMLGKIENEKQIDFYNPDEDNLVAQVSTDKVQIQTVNSKSKNILLIDCGAKRNIERALTKRGVNVITIPWDFNFLNSKEFKHKIDAIVISNGPGDPTKASGAINNVSQILNETKLPVLGICLGNQILTLAAGGATDKLKYGHRSQNQPCIMLEKGEKTARCFITTQNHGFEVSRVPEGFYPWFINANDGSNEGIIHKTRPVMSVQFHPEATPGPEDTEWIFDYFLEKI
jgi:carbamoyl-phosphate synthase small subunit